MESGMRVGLQDLYEYHTHTYGESAPELQPLEEVGSDDISSQQLEKHLETLEIAVSDLTSFHSSRYPNKSVPVLEFGDAEEEPQSILLGDLIIDPENLPEYTSSTSLTREQRDYVEFSKKHRLDFAKELKQMQHIGSLSNHGSIEESLPGITGKLNRENYNQMFGTRIGEVTAVEDNIDHWFVSVVVRNESQNNTRINYYPMVPMRI